MFCKRTSQDGFTLVELAVSMVVIGLLIGLGMAMVGPLMTSIKVRETKETIGGVVESINSWASGNNSLPDVAGFSNVAKSPNDSWGRPFIYVFDANLQTASPTKDTVCGRRSTFITLTDTNTGAVIKNVAYLVLSQGDDATTHSTIGGVAVVSGSRNAATAVTADTVNDTVRWVTLDELRTKAGCQGAQLRILNNELPPATVASPYPSATAGAALSFTVDGGATPGTYRWCIEATSATPLPSGMAFTTTTPALPIRVTPANSCSGLAEANWGAVTAAPNLLTLSGTPAAATQGAYSFTVYVRDNNDIAGSNDNIASKTFVLTVNPTP